MERTSSKITKTKGTKRAKTTIKNDKNNCFSELRKVRSKSARNTNENKLMVQLHHFANTKKSTTASKAVSLNLTAESKALLENDYYKIINAKPPKNTEFVAKPFVINKNTNTDPNFGDKIRLSVAAASNNDENIDYTKKEFKDLVLKKFKAKDRLPKNPFATACRDVNSMISIKDYHRVFCKKIFETRLFVNGLLVYDRLKQHYSGTQITRNCFKKKFINKLEKATKEIFPEMETFKTTTNSKEDRLLQSVSDYYENQENDMNLFNEQMIQIPNNINMYNNNNNNNENKDKNDADVLELIPNVSNGNEINLECDEDIMDRPITPVNEYFSPESFETPPSQRLIPFDFGASTVSKYQTVYYEKDAKSGKTSLFEIPQSFKVTKMNANNIGEKRCDFKRIDLRNDNIVASCSKPKGRVETARLIASGKLQVNELELICEPGASPTAKKPKKCPKKRLFHCDYSGGAGDSDSSDEFIFPPLQYKKSDENVFVRPMYSPKEFKEIKRMGRTLSPREFGAKHKSLKVDELDFYIQHDSGAALKNISKIKTPEHRYFPFVQFDRK